MSESEIRRKKRGSPPRKAGLAARKKLDKDLLSLKDILKELEHKFQLKERQYKLIDNENQNENGLGNPFGDELDDSGGGGDGGGGGGDGGGGGGGSSSVSGVTGLVGAEGSYVSRAQIQKRLQEQMLIEGKWCCAFLCTFFFFFFFFLSLQFSFPFKIFL